MTFPNYPEYKDSGVEWLGEVPSHWEILRLKHVLSQVTDRASRRTNPIGLENIEGWSGRFIDSESDFAGDGIAFDKQDLLFGKLRPYLAKVYLAKYSGEAVGDFHVMRPSPRILPKYAFHQLLQQQFISIVDGATHGAKMPRVGWEVMGNMPFATPPEPEQKCIAAFLDHETARIDALVEEQQRLIELLNEKRQAVISHAVTKGLDPDVPMKDSGVEWLGEVPAHWDVTRLKFLSNLISKGTTPTTVGAEFVDDGIRFLKAENVGDGRVKPEPLFFIDEASDTLLSRSRLQDGDVLVVIAGATTGRVAVAKEGDLPANTNQAVSFIRLRFHEMANFVTHWIQSEPIQHLIWLDAVQAAQPNLSMEDLGNIEIVVPPHKELKTLCANISTFEAGYHSATNAALELIDRLQERRSALISAAVTGKIDVRGWQPPARLSAAAEASETEAV